MGFSKIGPELRAEKKMEEVTHLAHHIMIKHSNPPEDTPRTDFHPRD
jgi:hypothetical protein